MEMKRMQSNTYLREPGRAMVKSEKAEGVERQDAGGRASSRSCDSSSA